MVARVWVDVPLAHLDREFDYAVPPDLDEFAVPGVRVRVRFAGRTVDGFIVGRSTTTEHVGVLAPLLKIVSAEPVLSPEIILLVRQVADRYAGTVSDVVRTAVPPRAARVEAVASETTESIVIRPDLGDWAQYEGGVALSDGVGNPGSPMRASLVVRPGHDWCDLIARLVTTAAVGGRGVLVIVPDATDVARVSAQLSTLLPGGFEVLSAALGPAPRYRAFLRIRRGAVRVVIGTRAAAFAPVHDLGLVVLWDDGDDLHAEPHAPYWHAREVLALRSLESGSHLVFAGHARTAEVARLVNTGWLRSLGASRSAIRTHSPRIVVAEETTGRIPQLAWRALRDGLREGPVLVQVPRRGYLPAVACRACRANARCPACAGPLTLGSQAQIARCGWCGQLCGDWACPACGGTQLRAVRVGSARTAEELGRSFPGTKVITSAGDHTQSAISGTALVIATPGAEPQALGGYAAAALLDAGLLLGRADLRAGEEALRRWLNAVALVRPGGQVVLAGAPPTFRAVQGLVRLDPVGFAERELAERIEIGLPPAVRVALVRGDAAGVADLLGRLHSAWRILGPIPDSEPERVRAMITAPVSSGPELAAALKAALATRSARKDPGILEVRLDPVVLG